MPTESRLSILFDLFATEQRVRVLVTRAMADAPLRPDEYAVYSVLLDEGPHTPSALAERVGMPPTTMSHYVRGLLERGHAVREVDPDDRRSFRLALTDAGRRIHREAARAFHEADRRFVEALDIGEVEARAGLTAIGRAADRATRQLADEATERTA